MHEIQVKILAIAKEQDVLDLGIRPLGKLIGVDKPQLVKHHLQQLIKKGLIQPKTRDEFKLLFSQATNSQPTLIKVPVLGAANCGPADLVAEEHFEEYVSISTSILKRTSNLFALVAKGDSMNDADVHGDAIEEDDYVIVDGSQRSPKSGDYVVSVIENCANVKRYSRAADGQIALVSESKSRYAPIYISDKDQFMVNGTVIQVLKNVR